MKAKNILKTLALPVAVALGMMATSCSSDDNIVNEQQAGAAKHEIPVTVSVTRSGDDATRATFNGTSKKLEFEEGDQLFVQGTDATAGTFAGVLSNTSGAPGTFSGTVTTQNEYTGTSAALFASASSLTATLLPKDYSTKAAGYLTLSGTGASQTLTVDATKAFVTAASAGAAKKLAIEQLSLEQATTYSSGFALAPVNAIASFTISGLTANKEVAVSFDTYGADVISRNVTTSAEGVATFAVGVSQGNDLKNCTLTVDGNNIAMPTKMTEAGHIYNISRNAKVVIWNSSKVAGIDINENPGDNSFESDGITVAAFGDSSASFADSKMSFENSDSYFTFTSSVRKIKKIEINYTGDVFGYEEETPVGWSLGVGTFTWEGDPATSVTLSSFGYARIEGITSIVFTLQ